MKHGLLRYVQAAASIRLAHSPTPRTWELFTFLFSGAWAPESHALGPNTISYEADLLELTTVSINHNSVCEPTGGGRGVQ